MNQDIKELLELAAKACGYRVSFDQKFNTFYWDRQEVSDEFVEWRPDLDDVAGARMEAELKTEFFWDAEKAGEVGVFAVDVSDIQIFERYADHNGNRQAARRMASLRVAAEIGRGMK